MPPMRCHRVTYRFAGSTTPDLAAWVETVAGRPLVAAPQWRPRADVWETPPSYVVRADVPGVNDDDLRVLLHPDVLVIEGTRRAERPESSRCHVAEIRSGPFRLVLRLPADVDPESADARLDRGVLTIVLPRTGRERPEVTR